MRKEGKFCRENRVARSFVIIKELISKENLQGNRTVKEVTCSFDINERLLQYSINNDLRSVWSVTAVLNCDRCHIDYSSCSLDASNVFWRPPFASDGSSQFDSERHSARECQNAAFSKSKDHDELDRLFSHVFLKMSKWATENTKQPSSSGVVFRLAVPLRSAFIICTDYKLARVVLAGTADELIKESEKTLLIQSLNLFPKVCSLLT